MFVVDEVIRPPIQWFPPWKMKMIKYIVFSIALVAAFSNEGHAWWDSAHMMTVEVAKTQLSPSVQGKIQELINYFEQDFPESSTLITASCFPDDITNLGLSGFKAWHGMLLPYDPEGILSEREMGIIQALVSTNNLHSAINQSLKVLKNPSASKWQRSFMMRFLLHCVGDIHQPLHCIHMYSKEFPGGDRAGHDFQLKNSKFESLHALWDSILGLGDKRFERPLSEEDEKWISSMSVAIVRRNPPDSFPQLGDRDVTSWSRESYDIAVAYAYEGIQHNTQPSEEYLSRGQEVALRQIALAGYRLAQILNDLYEQ